MLDGVVPAGEQGRGKAHQSLKGKSEGAGEQYRGMRREEEQSRGSGEGEDGGADSV
jgi:hypothetical protein